MTDDRKHIIIGTSAENVLRLTRTGTEVTIDLIRRLSPYVVTLAGSIAGRVFGKRRY